MREIKFRGKDLDNEFVYGNLYQTDDDLEYCEIQYYGLMGHINVTVKKNTIGQFTGLKDKNGVEIYEGDIVRIDRMANKYNVVSAVEYNRDSFMVINYWTVGKYAYQCEVIGNIYDNQELLK